MTVTPQTKLAVCAYTYAQKQDYVYVVNLLSPDSPTEVFDCQVVAEQTVETLQHSGFAIAPCCRVYFFDRYSPLHNN